MMTFFCDLTESPRPTSSDHQISLGDIEGVMRRLTSRSTRADDRLVAADLDSTSGTDATGHEDDLWIGALNSSLKLSLGCDADDLAATTTRGSTVGRGIANSCDRLQITCLSGQQLGWCCKCGQRKNECGRKECGPHFDRSEERKYR